MVPELIDQPPQELYLSRHASRPDETAEDSGPSEDHRADKAEFAKVDE